MQQYRVTAIVYLPGKKFNQRYKPWTKNAKPVPKSRLTGPNNTKTTNKPSRTPQQTSTQPHGEQTIQSLCVTGILTPSGSSSQWQSVAIHKSGSYVPIQESSRVSRDPVVGISQDQIESSGVDRDQTLCHEINQGQNVPMEIANNQNRTVGLERDQDKSYRNSNRSEKRNKDQNKLSSSDKCDHQRSEINRNQLQPDVIIIEDSSNVSDNTKSISDQHRDQINDLHSKAQQSPIHTTRNGKEITGNLQLQSAPQSSLSESGLHLSGTGNSQPLLDNDMHCDDATCIDESNNVADVHNNIQSSSNSGCGVVPYKPVHGMRDVTCGGNILLGTKSPKRKG